MEPLSAWRLDWSADLSVGIPEIDLEHQRFIELINDLNEAISHRMSLAEIRRRMQLILADAEAHFAHEEQLFRAWQYPDAETHAMKHASLNLALNDIMGKFTHNGSEYEWIAAGLRVKEALVDHLLHEDMKYRDFNAGREGTAVSH